MNLFPSTLIISAQKIITDQKLGSILAEFDHQFNPNNPDLFIIDQTSGWGIEKIREIKKFLSQKPFNHSSNFVLIFESQKLNQESQNTLLKILEEPGTNNYLILITNKPSQLLPTIISRCHIIKLQNTQITKTKLLKITGDLQKNLLTSETLSQNKENILPLLEDQLHLYQAELIKNPGQQNRIIIEKIIKSIQMIQSNVDPRSALDYFFLEE